MIQKKEHTGIILAGGKSSRMGKEKGLLLLDYKSFVQRIAEALQPLVEEIIIVSDHKEYDQFGYKRVEDVFKDAGPIGGLYAGLLSSTTDSNFVISCDVPLITTALLSKLTDSDEEHFDVIQFRAQDKSMPLIALYKKRCVAVCKKQLETGERRLRKLVASLSTKSIPVDEKEYILVSNINTPEDLKNVRYAINN